MSYVTTPPPSVKRPRTEDNATTLPPSVKRLKKEDNIVRPNMEANLYDKGTADEDMIDKNMSGEDMSSEEVSAEETSDESERDSNSEMSFSSGEAGSPEPTTAQGTMPILPFDKEYPDPEECLETGMSVSQCQEEIEQELDDEDVYGLAKYERGARAKRRKLLKKLHATASVWGLEKMDILSLTGTDGKTTVSQKEEISNSDSKDWSKPDAVGWKSAADGSRLLPEAIELMLKFFEDRQHVNRAECEEYCLKAYLEEGVGAYEARERPLNIQAYPSECQYADSYMVEIIDTTITNPALMTQFYITPQRLDEGQLARAKEAYGNFVPEYTYVGHMGLAPNHPEELFVWRIVSPAGRPFAADGYRLGLRVNQDKYVGILKDFVDFVCEPLRLAGGSDRLSNVKDWPMVLHNHCLDVYNIIIRPDWSGIACVLLWGAPPVMTLPFGASLSGLLYLEGNPAAGTDKDGDPICKANPSLFNGYSREARELQRLWIYYLREKHSALANDPQPWHRLFEAMGQGIPTAADSNEVDNKCYGRQVDELEWDWFHFEMDPSVPGESAVACAESGRGEEDGDVDMDMDMDID